jgi:hypothetical protein
MSGERGTTFESWAEERTLDEAMGMGTVRVLQELAQEMEEYRRFGPPEHQAGTRFWLEQVRDLIELYSSRETPSAGDGYITKLLADYDRLRPAGQLSDEQKSAAEAEAGASLAREQLEERKRGDQRSWIAGKKGSMVHAHHRGSARGAVRQNQRDRATRQVG